MQTCSATLTLKPCRSYRSFWGCENNEFALNNVHYVHLGEIVFWVTDEGVQQQMVMLKGNGTLFQLEKTLGNWVTLD